MSPKTPLSLPLSLLWQSFLRYPLFYLPIILVFGALLLPMATGGEMGIFLWEPFFKGQINGWSFIFLGIGWGCLITAWQVSLFVLLSDRLPSIFNQKRPLSLFSLNNALLPVLLIGTHIIILFTHLSELPLSALVSILLLPCFAILTQAVLYVLAEHPIINPIKHRSISKPLYSIKKQNPSNTKEQSQKRQPLAVSWYFNLRLQKIYLDESGWEEPSFKSQKLSNYQLNLLLLALFILLIIQASIQLPLDSKFHLPAATGMLFLMAMAILLFAAITYWLGRWASSILLLLLTLLLYTQRLPSPLHHNNYSITTAQQNEERIRLIKWRSKFQKTPPYILLIQCEGQGQSSIVWTFSALQALDQKRQYSILNHTFAISGQGSGLLGAAYYRELFHRKQSGYNLNLSQRAYRTDLEREIFNPMMFNFLLQNVPSLKSWVSPNARRKDQVLEKKLHEYTRGMLSKSPKAYRQDEKAGLLPELWINASYQKPSTESMLANLQAEFLLGADALLQRRFGSHLQLEQFLQYHEEWLLKNTAGVILLTISDVPITFTQSRQQFDFPFFHWQIHRKSANTNFSSLPLLSFQTSLSDHQSIDDNLSLERNQILLQAVKELIRDD
ncbi:hypothetical protein [Persicobacter diffluens]|uniref:PNPLA domain-containing protein n=1 Tax=Persicobacter diffluens TaxID=981 RepID=A0AAN4VXC5_9BACT|nr:hypothetical protein PEDI_22980 [Persicobacter diffluens]